MKGSKTRKIVALILIILIITVTFNGMFYKVNAGTIESEKAQLEDDTEVEVKMKILDESGNQLELSEKSYVINFEKAKGLRFVISIDMSYEDAVVGGIDSDGNRFTATDDLSYCPWLMYDVNGNMSRGLVPVSVTGDFGETYEFVYKLDEKDIQNFSGKINTFKANLNRCQDSEYRLGIDIRAMEGGLTEFKDEVTVFNIYGIYIDDIIPKGTITYVTNEEGSVTATVTFEEGNVTITNNDGKNTYTFTENGEFTFEFEDQAGNKGSAKAEVTSIKTKEPEVEFKTLETKEESGKVYVKVGRDSTVDSIKSDIDTAALAGKTVEIENLTEDGKIKTGSTITIDGNVQCIIVVNGDVDGDGAIDFIGDIITANNYRLELIDLEVEQKLASDIDGDGKVDFIKDLIKINNYRLGLIDSL